MKKYLIYISIILLSASCSKDLGNYDYSPIAAYEVSGIKRTNYNIVLGQRLIIEPVIESSLEEVHQDLSYLWIIESDTVSHDRQLDYTVDLPIALYEAQFVVIDNITGIKNYTAFRINVTSPFGRGYFFLNQDEDSNTILSFKSVSDEDNTIINSDNIDGFKFGKYPMKMAGYPVYGSSANDYRWQVFIVSKESEYPVVFADLTMYMPLRFFDKHSYIGSWSTEYEFKPTHVELRSSGHTYFISNGRIAYFKDGNLYRHSLLFDNTPDYKLDNIIIGDINRLSSIKSVIGFDLISSKFKVISPYPDSDPEKGITYDRNLLDRVLEIESQDGIFDGHRVIGEHSEVIFSTSILNSKVLTVKGNTVHLTHLNSEYAEPFVPKLDYKGSQTIPGLDETASLTTTKDLVGDAYLSVGNKIYKSSLVTLSFAEYLNVDTSLGEITAIKYQVETENGETPRLFVCTYDPNSSEELKGSILVYDVNSKSIIHELRNVTNQVVDIFLAE